MSITQLNSLAKTSMSSINHSKFLGKLNSGNLNSARVMVEDLLSKYEHTNDHVYHKFDERGGRLKKMDDILTNQIITNIDGKRISK